MNNTDNFDEEILRKFLNPEKIEKAPEGFTSKTMTRIQIENQASFIRKGFLFRYRVPLVSAGITSALILLAMILPADNPGSAGSAIWGYFRYVKINLQSVSNIYMPEIELPGWILYAIIALFLLIFFDRALFRIFRKE